MESIIELHYHQKGRDALYNSKHFHDDSYEIIQVITGTGNFLINNTLYPLSCGDIYFIDGSVIHCSIPSDNENYIRNKLVFKKVKTDNVFAAMGYKNIIYDNFFKTGGRYVRLSAQESSRIDGMFMILGNMYERNIENNELFYYSKMMELFYIFSSGQMKEDESNDVISRILIHINKNITCDITIDDIAREFHLSKYYLCHKFHKDTNMTINQYIRSYRISLAKQKLISTDMSITDVSKSVGFVNFSHFSKVFCESAGITPSNFRKQFKNISLPHD